MSHLSSVCWGTHMGCMHHKNQNHSGHGSQKDISCDENWMGVGLYLESSLQGTTRQGAAQGFVSIPLPSFHLFLHPLVCSVCSLHCAFRNCPTLIASVVLSSFYANRNHFLKSIQHSPSDYFVLWIIGFHCVLSI